jgi:hypothetical protein
MIGGTYLFQPELSPPTGGVVGIVPPPIGGGGIVSTSSFDSGSFDSFFTFPTNYPFKIP